MDLLVCLPCLKITLSFLETIWYLNAELGGTHDELLQYELAGQVLCLFLLVQ